MRKVIFSLLLFFNFLLIGQDAFEFLPNGGQLHDNVLYKADVPSGAVFLESDGIKYSFYDPSFFNTIHEGGNPGEKIHFCAAASHNPKSQVAGSESPFLSSEKVHSRAFFFLGKKKQ